MSARSSANQRETGGHKSAPTGESSFAVALFRSLLGRRSQNQLRLRCATHLAQARDTDACGPIPEAFAGAAFARICFEQRPEQRRDFMQPDFVTKEFCQARSEWRTTQIEAVQIRAVTDNTDFRRVRPRATVRTTRHANTQRLSAEAGRVPGLLNLHGQTWPYTLAFRNGLAARRQCRTRHRLTQDGRQVNSPDDAVGAQHTIN